MQKFILGVFFLFLCTNAIGQSEVQKFVYKILDEISKKEKELAKMQELLNKYISQENSNDQKLKEALKQKYFLVHQLEKAKSELSIIKDSVSNLLNNNLELKEQIELKNFELFSLKEKTLKYDSTIAQLLKQQGKEQLNLEAKNSAQLDFNLGKKTTSQSKFGYKEPLFFLSAGYKFNQGASLHGVYGYTINKERNIFLGIGTGFDYFEKQNFSTLPIYISSRFAFPDYFVNAEKKTINDNTIAYGIVDIGYPILLTKESTNTSPRFFTNIGLGGLFYIYSNNISISTELSWRMQSIKILNQMTVSNMKFVHSIDLKLGLLVYLAR